MIFSFLQSDVCSTSVTSGCAISYHIHYGNADRNPSPLQKAIVLRALPHHFNSASHLHRDSTLEHSAGLISQTGESRIAMTISTNRLILEQLTTGASDDPYSIFDDDEIRGELITEVALISSKALQNSAAVSERWEVARKNSISNFKTMTTRSNLLSPIISTSTKFPTLAFESETLQSSESPRPSKSMTRQGHGRNLPRLDSPASGTRKSIMH